MNFLKEKVYVFGQCCYGSLVCNFSSRSEYLKEVYLVIEELIFFIFKGHFFFFLCLDVIYIYIYNIRFISVDR